MRSPRGSREREPKGREPDERDAGGRTREGRSRGLPATAIALAIVLGVFGIAAAIWLARSKPRAPAPAVVKEAQADPFASVPDEVPPPRSLPAGGEGASSPFGATDPKDAGFKVPSGDLKKEGVWVAAREKADLAKKRIEEATSALKLGDKSTAAEKGKEAQKLLDQALASTADWATALAEQYGDGAPAIRAIDRERQNWAREVMALKKFTEL